MRKAISSKILSDDRINEIINEHYDYSLKDIEDKRVDTQTIGRCIVAGAVATIISGSLLGILFIYTNAVHILILVGVALLCFAIIKAIVRKSKNNAAVIFTTIISSITAIGLGYFLVHLFGVMP